MYDTDELYAEVAAKLGVTPEALDEAIGGHTLIKGDSYLIEVTPDDDPAIYTPRSAEEDDGVPATFVLLTAAMLRLDRDPAFAEDIISWMESLPDAPGEKEPPA